MRFLIFSIGLLLLSLTSVSAQEARRPSHCIAIADAAPGMQFVHKASWQQPVSEDEVRISYVSHASFLIQTPGGLNAVTDFTGFIGMVEMVPDVVTMNHAHGTHWTAEPDPRIPHVLPGWGDFGEGISHHLDLGEMLVRNVSTDIRSQWGGEEPQGNSIFVFEVAGLCIGHLGHLHHVPNDEQFAALGRLDVVMAPVDGGMTLPLADMVTVLKRLKSSVVIPMHWFSGFSLEQFLSEMSPTYRVVRSGETSLEVSLRDLPSVPEIHVLQPRSLREPE